MGDKIYIRASMLTSWNDCPRRCAAQQYRKLIESAGYSLTERPPNIGAIVGTSTHAGVEVTLQHWIDHASHAKKNDCVEAGIETLKSEISSGAIWDATTSRMSEAESQVQQMVTSYYVQVAPTIIPDKIETQREAVMLTNVVFSGKSDVETIDSIRDIKTGVREKPFHAQLGGYSLLRSAELSHHATTVVVDYLPRVSTKKTYPGAKTIVYDVAQCEKIAYYTITQIAGAVKLFVDTKNVFAFPCNPMSMLCGDKYCTAYKTNFCSIYR